MYTGPLPEAKMTSPVPDALAAGEYTVDGETVSVAGWRAMHGHNWGKRQAYRYAWCQAAGFREEPDAVFEAISVRLLRGPFELPWLSAFWLYLDGAWLRFDAPRSIAGTPVRAGVMRYAFECAQVPYDLRGEALARPEDTVGLHYNNPAAPITYCLNTKLADLSLRLRGPHGERLLTTNRAALEIGWPSADHGIAMMA
jgi:hypothetical protein